jgi:hypothetical protein
MDTQWNWQSVCPPRVVRSLFAGAATGGLLFSIWYVIGAAVERGLFFVFQSGLLTATGIFVATFFVWTIGLIAFGIGPWWLFHRIGFRNLVSAIVLGFSLTFLVNLAIASHLAGLLSPPPGAHEVLRDAAGAWEIDYTLTSRGWRLAVEGAAELGVVGALVAAVIWRTAYRTRRTDRDQVEDAKGIMSERGHLARNIVQA